MSHGSLADFLEELHRLGELRLVEDEVDGEGVWLGTGLPGLDSRRDVIPQLTHTAVLFRNVRGQSFPIAAGLLATQARICRALGVAAPAEAANRVAAAFSTAPPRESLVRDGVGRHDACLARHAPRLVKTGESQKIVRLGGDVDLEQLPGPKRPSRLETHRTLTAGVLATRDPDSGEPVVGHAVASIRSRDELAVHFEPLDPLAGLLDAYRRRGESMPLALALGGHPARLLAAMASTPFPVDRDCLAGLLRGHPLDNVRGRSVNLEVPAEADFVVEGAIDPAAASVETGPIFTPLAGTAASRPAPIFRVTALTRRANPVVPMILPWSIASEWTVIARTMHRVLLPLMRLLIDELADCNLPEFGMGRTMAWVSIRKKDDQSAPRVARALWDLPGTRFCSLMVLVDEDVDVDDGRRIWAAKGRNIRGGRDVFMEEGPPDPWANGEAAGQPCQRLAFDATSKQGRN